MQHLPDDHFITKLYRRFCNLIYHEASFAYNLTSWVVSGGKWRQWQGLALNYIQEGKVFELGCGTGRIVKQLKENKKDFVALDYSMEMVKLSKKTALLKEAKLIRGDGMQLPFKNKSFANIIATFPEQYIVTEECISECARVLRNDDVKGRLIIVGRWIVMHNPILKPFFPVFYRQPTEEQLSEIKSKMSRFDFNVTIHEHRIGWVSVYVIQADLQ